MVIIIGAGPIGLACGIALRERGIPFLIIEKGCLVNSVFNYPTNMIFFSTSDRLEIGGVPFISHGAKATRREALEYYRRIKESFRLPVNVYEEVHGIEGEDGNFKVSTSKGVYRAEKVIIATGFFDTPNLMKVPGEGLPKVKHYYDEPHPYAGMCVLVVGGGNSAVDVALETYRCGCTVTLAVREPDLKEGIKYWVRPDIENRIKEGSIKAWFNTEVKEIREDEVDLLTPEGPVTIKNDFVLAMTGYRPRLDFLERIGVPLLDDDHLTPVFDAETMESGKKGIYLAGVVCGGMNTSKWFIENSIEHAERIANHMVGK